MSTPGSETPLLVSELGERGLIERIRQRAGSVAAGLTVGIGDDAAVAAPERGALQVLTTDALVEGIHFERRFSSLSDVGYKALAVNVSDIAAMGATPALALLSLMLPPSTTAGDVDALLDGFLELAADVRVTLAGGNITASPGPLIVDVTVTGHVRPRKLLTRGAGRAGEALFVTGEIGAAAAGLGWLKTGRTAPVPQPADCVARYRRPVPRARFGRILGATRVASACMDLSDGLADAVTQVAEASGTGAIVDADALPISEGTLAWFAARGEDPVVASVAGGEDYELLFAAPKRAAGRLRAAIRQGRGLKVTHIGELTRDSAVLLRRQGRTEPLPRGFTHF